MGAAAVFVTPSQCLSGQRSEYGEGCEHAQLHRDGCCFFLLLLRAKVPHPAVGVAGRRISPARPNLPCFCVASHGGFGLNYREKKNFKSILYLSLQSNRYNRI